MKEKKKQDNTKRKKKQLLIAGCMFLVMAIAFTAVVKFVDVRSIGPNGSNVGLSAINRSVNNMFGGFNDFWYRLTEKTGLLLVLPVAAMALIGLVELIKRKSFKKVDREFKVLAGFYAIVALIYIFFEKVFVVNYRPVMIEGELEASYPSSHTMFAFCFCCSAIYVTNRVLRNRNKKLAIAFNALLALILVVNVVGRLLSGAHWFTDIFGGVLISAALVAFFNLVLILGDKESAKTKVKTAEIKE